MRIFKKYNEAAGKSMLALAGIIILCLMLRIIYLYQLKSTPLFGLFPPDSYSYDRFALKILKGELFFKESLLLNPLYPVFLAVIYAIFGHNYTAVFLVQILLDSLTCLFLYLICLEAFGRRGIGLAASFIYALYAIAVFYTGFLLDTTLLTFLYALLILILLKAKDKDNKALWFISGLIAGASLLLKANLLLFLPFLVIWLFLIYQCEALLKRLNRAGIIFSGILIVLIPFSIKNLAAGGTFSPFPLHGGINFYIGNNPDAAGTYMHLAGISDFSLKHEQSSILVAERETGRDLTPQEASRYWFSKGLGFIRNNPQLYIRILAKKFLLFWNKQELEGNLNFAFCRRFMPVFNYPLFSFGLIAPLAITGLIYALRERSIEVRLLVLFISSYVLSLLIYFVHSRYRFPSLPFIIIFGAYMLRSFAHSVRPFDPKRLTAFTLVFVASLFFVNMPAPGIPHDEQFFVEHNNLALVYIRQGRLDEAMAECRKALEINPNFAEAYARLGDIYSDKSIYEEAIVEYREAIRLNPYYAEAHDNLGVAYFKKGRIEDAIDEYKKAVQINPDYYPSAYSNLGLAYYKKGLIDKAISQYKKSIYVDPGYPDAYNNLGILYIKENMLDEAIRELERGVTAGAEYAEVYYNLGIAYFKKGMTQKAITSYKKAIEIDPGYAAAYNNLAVAFFYQKEYNLAVEYMDKAEELGIVNAELLDALKPYRRK